MLLKIYMILYIHDTVHTYVRIHIHTYMTCMLKIYVATTTETETMLVSNLPCWKFKKYARMSMACGGV
jgi:hypothetical protein